MDEKAMTTEAAERLLAAVREEIAAAPTLDELKQLDRAVTDRLKAMRAGGVGISDASLPLARLNVFIASQLGAPADSAERRRFERDWLDFLAAQLDAIEAQARIEKLRAGVNGASLSPRPDG